MSPQCGFASTEEGNQLTEEQWTKLKYVVNELLGSAISTILNSKNTKLDELTLCFQSMSMFNKAYCLIIARVEDTYCTTHLV